MDNLLLHCNSVLPKPMCRSVLSTTTMWKKFQQVFLVVGSSLGTCCLIYSAAQHLGCCPEHTQAALELPQVEVESWCIDMALGSVDVPWKHFPEEWEHLYSQVYLKKMHKDLEFESLEKHRFKVRHWKSLCREAVDAPGLKGPGWMKLWTTWSSERCPWPWQEFGTRWSFQPRPFYDSLKFLLGSTSVDNTE